MATTINSGYANSPKLTANIADRADVYGGRSLIFDGVVDYLSTNSNSPISGSNPFTMSAWINPSVDVPDTSNDYMTFIKQGSASTDQMACFSIVRVSNVNYLGYLTHGNDLYSNHVVPINAWSHVVVTYSSGTYANGLKIYLNGEVHSSLTGRWSGSATSGTPNVASTVMEIGKQQDGNSAYFNGKIADVKIFDTALTEAQVQELYKKPESTPSQDNLALWYPMIEGNPESPQSIVYDHSEKKLGTNLVTNGTFDSDISGWSLSNPDSERTISHATIGGRTCVDISDQSTSNRSEARFDCGSSLEDGAVYKLCYYVRKSQADSTNKYYIINLGIDYIHNNGATFDNAVLEWDTWEYREHYIVAQTSNNFLQFMATSTGTGLNNAHIGRLFLDDVKLQKVPRGNHATTSFFGNELAQDGGFATATASSTTGAYWTTGSAWDINTTSSGKAYVNNTGGGNNSIFQSSSNGSVSSNPLTAGKTYRTTGTAVISSLDAGTYLNVMSGGSTTKTIVPAGSSGTVNFDEEFLADTGTLQYRMVGVGSLTLDDVTVREVGVSSSGFETAVNEPVVPQVPLMRYNEKIFFNGNDGSGTEVLWENIGGAFASSKFTLSIVHLGKNQNEIFTLFDITESPYTDYLRLYKNASGRYYAYIENANDTKTIYQYNIYADDEKYNHIVLTCDGSKWCFYINGYKVREDSFTHTTEHLSQAHTDMRVGMIGHTGEQYRALGIIDELSLWSTALTYDEVRELYAGSVVKDATTHSKSDDYLLGYWRNDGATTWTDRSDAQAINFNGVSDKVDFGSDVAISGDFSVSWWMYVSDENQGFAPLFYKAGNYVLYFRDSGNFLLRINSYGGVTFDSASVVSENQFHHFALVRSGSDVDLYVDGTSINDTQTVSGGSFTFDQIGFDDGSAYLGANISQLACWSSALSASDISSIYAFGRKNTDLNTSYSTNLVGYWLFNGSHSTPDTTGNNGILDRSTNSNHGTITGANLLGTNNGSVQGTPKTITIREGLNSNKDGLGFNFTNPSSNVLRLNGVDEYLLVDKTGSFPSGDQSRSVTCWIKPHSFPSGNDQPIVFMGTYDGNKMFTVSFLYNSTNRISVWGYNNDYTGSDVLTIDNWWYVGVTYDSGTNTLKSYIGGGADNINPALDINNTSVTDFNTTYGDIKIGRAQNKYFDGMIDEVKIYNRALSADEILKDFKHQKGKHKND